jgi:hypothetical protein
MKKYALELNDAGLVLAGVAENRMTLLAESPGYASLLEADVLTGPAAAQRSRLQPLLTHNRYWSELSTDALARPNARAQTNADLAYVQLSHLLSDRHSEGASLLLAIPAGYSREQLGLLLGIVQETGWTVAGLVDAALAACATEAPPGVCAHLDLQLHRSVLTTLEQDGQEGLQRTQFNVLPGLGLARFEQTWMQLVSDAFVRQTRFDPLHQAASEQQLFDRLPQWLAALNDNETIELELPVGEETRRAEVHRAQFLSAAEPHYDSLLKLLNSARRAGTQLPVYVSARMAALPGFLARLHALGDCEPHTLPQVAAVEGALANFDHIRRPAESLALLHRLPVRHAAAPSNVPAVLSAEHRPTHVLHSGRAWLITDQPLVLGWAVVNGERVLKLPPGAPGVSRAHCTIAMRQGMAVVEDHSTYGTFVNDAKVDGISVLRVGDKLRLGAPGITVQLIQAVEDHAAS